METLEKSSCSIWEIMGIEEQLQRCPNCRFKARNCFCKKWPNQPDLWDIVYDAIDDNLLASSEEIEENKSIVDSNQSDLKKKNEEKLRTTAYNNSTFREGDVDRFSESQEQNKLSAKNGVLKRSLEVSNDGSSQKIIRKGSQKKRKLEKVDEDNTFDLKDKEKLQSVNNMKFVSDDTQIDENLDSAFNILDLFVSDSEDDGTLSNLESEVHEIIKENESSNIPDFNDGFVTHVQSSPVALVDQDGFQKGSKTSHNKTENEKYNDQESFTITFDNHLDGNKQKERQSDYSHTHLSKKNNTSEKISRSDSNTFDSKNVTLSTPKELPVEVKNAAIRDVLYDVCAAFEKIGMNKTVTSNNNHNRIYEKCLSKKSDMKSSNGTIKSESMHSKIKTDSGLITKSLEDNHDDSKLLSEKQLSETAGTIALDNSVNKNQVSQSEHSEKKTDNSDTITSSSRNNVDSKPESDKHVFKIPDSRITNILMHQKQVRQKMHSKTKTVNLKLITNSPRDNLESTFPIKKQRHRTPTTGASDISMNKKPIVESDHCYTKTHNSQFISRSLTENADGICVNKKEQSKTQDVGKSDQTNQRQTREKVHSKCETNNSESFSNCFKSNSAPNLFLLASSGIECDPEIRNEYEKEVEEKFKRMKKDLLVNDEGETETLKEHLNSSNLGMPSISQHKNLQTKETEDSIMLREAPKIKYQQKFSNNQIANKKKSEDAKNNLLNMQDDELDFIDSVWIAKTLNDLNFNDESDGASPSTEPEVEPEESVWDDADSDFNDVMALDHMDHDWPKCFLNWLNESDGKKNDTDNKSAFQQAIPPEPSTEPEVEREQSVSDDEDCDYYDANSFYRESDFADYFSLWQSDSDGKVPDGKVPDMVPDYKSVFLRAIVPKSLWK